MQLTMWFSILAGDDVDVLARGAQHGADEVDVAGLVHEAGWDEVHLVRHAQVLQVFDVLHTYIHTHTHSQGDLCAVSTGQGPHLLRQQVHYRPYTATRERDSAR